MGLTFNSSDNSPGTRRFAARETGVEQEPTSTAKLMADIRFLTERIEQLQAHKTPNATMLKTYRTMLESREQVLGWLQQRRGA